MYGFLVVLQGLSEDENVVQVDYHDPVSYEILKNVIYHSLKCSRTVSHIKEYY